MSRRPAGDAIDVHIGKRVRERRIKLGMSQKQLADTLDISFQQIQKNERGTNRIGASRLHEISQALDVPVSFFFDDLPPQPPVNRPGRKREPVEALPPEVLLNAESQKLIEAYYRIENRFARKQLLQFLRGLADR